MLAFTALFCLVTAFCFHNFYWKRRKLPPGPIPWPIISNIHILVRGSPSLTFLRLSKIYGPVLTIWIGYSMPMVVITDYQVLIDNIVKKGDAFAGRPKNKLTELLLDDVIVRGLIFSEGSYWKQQRRFTLHVMRDFGFGRSVMEDRIFVEVDKFRRQICAKIGQKQQDIALPLENCIGNIINSILFGYGFEPDDEKFLRLKTLLDRHLKLVTKPELLLLGSMPLLRFLPPFKSVFDQVRTNIDILVEFFNREIDSHQANFNPDEVPTDYTAAYLQELHRKTNSDDGPGSFSVKQLRFLLLDLWIAGMETTVTTLRWAFLYMLRYPDVQRNIHKEIDEAVGRDVEIRMAHKNLLPYTMATLQETQRFANILPLNIQRRTMEKVDVCGYEVPEDTLIMPQVATVHVNPEYFPQPEEFKPERFLEEDGKAVKKVDQLLPFSLGKRQCPGESLARMELFLVFTAFMQQFEIELPEGAEPPTLNGEMGITLTPVRYRCFVKKR